MELRTLRYFLAIAEEGSITAASARLHVTQPTLSRQIKELETELGKALFVRHSHSMSLTREGTALRRRAEKIIEMAEQAREELAALSVHNIGDVYLGGAETDATSKIAHAIQAFQADYPKSCVHFTSGNTEDVITRLDSGVLDFVILTTPTAVSKYECLTLSSDERWVLYTRRDNPLAHKPFVRSQDLIDEPLIISRQVMRKNTSNNAFAGWLGDAFRRVHVVATFNLPFVGGVLAREGLGSAITWEGLLDISKESGLVAVPLEPAIKDETVICWHKNATLSLAASTFLRYLKAELEPADDG